MNNFLGLPTDDGLHHLSARSGNALRNEFDVNRGTAEGPRGGVAAGASVTGPKGNTAYRGAAEGPDGGVAAGRGVAGAGGAAAAQGVAEGPRGGVAAREGFRGPGGAEGVRGAAVGPYGRAAAGFARVSPSGRYTAAAAVRGNYDHWGVYGADWYTAHPAAWRAAAWGTGAAWRAATWASVGTWMNYADETPVYYDYGNNVTYQNNDVYVNGQDTGSAQQYYDQASSLASSGAQADATTDGDWLPLGVFALTQTDRTKSDVTIQLAINKQGMIRGNYSNTSTGETKVIQGSVDKKTQRVAFTVGDNRSEVVETGLYNLTKDEAPALIHFSAERTEQWLLVRLKNPDESGGGVENSSRN